MRLGTVPEAGQSADAASGRHASAVPTPGLTGARLWRMPPNGVILRRLDSRTPRSRRAVHSPQACSETWPRCRSGIGHRPPCRQCGSLSGWAPAPGMSAVCARPWGRSRALTPH